MEKWEIFWPAFLDAERLRGKIDEIDEVNRVLEINELFEDICHEIYDKYHKDLLPELKRVQRNLLEEMQDIVGVHLSTSRVKTCESLLRKVIIKHHKYLLAKDNPYVWINGKNYNTIITDLLGLRFIVNYRGNWKAVHEGIIEKFPLLEKTEYEGRIPLTHRKEPIQVEWPKAYYAEGDNISEFVEAGLDTRLHEKGYRSIHYTLSYQNTYVELQVRTIYDEAWSDVDHRYVYKQEANVSSTALRELSVILSNLTNISNDIGDEMRKIFDGELKITNIDNRKWLVSKDVADYFDITIKKLSKSVDALQRFRGAMTIEH